MKLIHYRHFLKILEYRISLKCVQRDPSCSMRTDMTQQTVDFRNFANAPKKYRINVQKFVLYPIALHSNNMPIFTLSSVWRRTCKQTSTFRRNILPRYVKDGDNVVSWRQYIPQIFATNRLDWPQENNLGLRVFTAVNIPDRNMTIAGWRS